MDDEKRKIARPQRHGEAVNRRRWWEPIVVAVIAAAVFSAAFIIMSLLIHGSVKW